VAGNQIWPVSSVGVAVKISLSCAYFLRLTIGIFASG
jgi:hypothetical protein